MESQKISYEELLQRIQLWDIPSRIDEKFHYWQLKHTCPKLTHQWLQLIRHSLLHYLLSQLPSLFTTRNHQQYLKLHAGLMQSNYSLILLHHNSKFDLKIVILVKIVTYFIGSHYPQTLTDQNLENDIYQLTIRTIIGIEVEPKAYQTIIKSLRRKKNKNRQSMEIDEEYSRLCIPTTKSIGRRNGKTRHNLTHKMTQIQRQYTQLQDYKKCLKQNLYVKPIPKPKLTQISIQQLKKIHVGPKNTTQQINKDKPSNKNQKEGHKNRQIIGSTQISQALHYNSSLKLTDVKNFSIHCSPKKKIDVVRVEPSKLACAQFADKKTKRDIPIQKNGAEQQKSPRKWLQLLQQMRQKTYKSRKIETDPNQHSKMDVDDRLNRLVAACNNIEFHTKSIPVLNKKFHRQAMSHIEEDSKIQLAKKHIRLMSQPQREDSLPLLPHIKNK